MSQRQSELQIFPKTLENPICRNSSDHLGLYREFILLKIKIQANQKWVYRFKYHIYLNSYNIHHKLIPYHTHPKMCCRVMVRNCFFCNRWGKWVSSVFCVSFVILFPHLLQFSPLLLMQMTLMGWSVLKLELHISLSSSLLAVLSFCGWQHKMTHKGWCFVKTRIWTKYAALPLFYWIN